MRRWVLGIGCVVASCGGARPASPAAPPSTVEVPDATPASEPEPSSTAPEATRAGDSRDCVAGLRRAADVPAEGEERAAYDRALAAEERGDLLEARKQYFAVVSEHPRSRLIPLAYLAFGELFAREARTDPSKLDLATASYTEVVKYPPPDNVAYAYALWRLGETRLERNDQQAMVDFKRAIEAAGQHSTQGCSELVRERAEDGLVETYSRVGQPERAWAFFRSSAGEARGRAMLVALTARYKKHGKAAEACAAARGAASDAAGADLARSLCP